MCLLLRKVRTSDGEKDKHAEDRKNECDAEEISKPERRPRPFHPAWISRLEGPAEKPMLNQADMPKDLLLQAAARSAWWPKSTRFQPLRRGGGAQERTRTFTAVKPLAPEASASTNSATWACLLGTGAVTTDR